MPVELKTKVSVVPPDGLLVEYASGTGSVGCIWRVAPGEAAEIVKRLELYPELVEMLERTAHSIDEAQLNGAYWACGDVDDDIKALLARCKEVPDG